MSRPLVFLAALCFAVVALGPVAAMAWRTSGADVAALDVARGAGLLLRTAQLGLGAAAIALALGVPSGWLVARSDAPFTSHSAPK